VLRLHQLKQRVQEDICAAQTSLQLLQAQRERFATRANFPQIRDSSSAYSASQIYQSMAHVPPAGLARSSMLNSNPVTVPSWPSVSSYATAQPAVRATNQQLGSYGKPLDLIPVDAICRVSSESRAASVENNDTSKVSSSQPLTKKRCQKVSNGDNDSEDDDNNDSGDVSTNGVRFVNYLEAQWNKCFDELRRHRDRTGNCVVPQSYKSNQPLARWVKRQRYQYKLMIDGKPSQMTQERMKALEEIRFVWCPQDSNWAERLEEVKKYRRIFNHCNVPSDYHENPSLVSWVKYQRRQYKLYQEGKPSYMTVQRILDLEDIGFEWALRGKHSSGS
jgi:hypothetical protein